jgi:hypothetical protein
MCRWGADGTGLEYLVGDATDVFGRSIQLFLVDGSPNGLIVASIHGWTGSVLVARQSTFSTLIARPEVDRTGVYILFGPDPNDALSSRAYVGEADSVRDRIKQSAGARGFWEIAVVITTSDEALTKGHVRYLEARLIEMAKSAGRVILDNGQEPSADKKKLPEVDRSNMEAFLANLKVILPVVGLDLLKPRPVASVSRGAQAISKRRRAKDDSAARPRRRGRPGDRRQRQHSSRYSAERRRLAATRSAGCTGPLAGLPRATRTP